MALANCDDVRDHPEALEGEQSSGAAEAGLDLIEDQQGAGLCTSFAQPLHPVVRRHSNPSLSLNRLDDDARRFLGDGIQRQYVIERKERHTWKQRLVRCTVHVTSRDRKRPV